MIRVHVVCGGTSDERAVSLRSGANVAAALDTAGYQVATCDLTDSDTAITDCDVVFPVLHGVGGEDGQLQRRLEDQGVPFVGTGSAGSLTCLNKEHYRRHMTAQGFLMAPGEPVTREQYWASPLAKTAHVIKPIDGGSSIDLCIVRDPTTGSHAAQLDAIFARHPRMLLEQLVEGTEITVGVLGAQALPVIEIIPPAGREFDYENKYNGKTQELCPPLHVSEVLQRAAQDQAVRIHSAAGCRHLSRTDFIIAADGTLYLLETNTIPGMTAQSLYPKMAAAAGLSFPALTDRLVQMALTVQ